MSQSDKPNVFLIHEKGTIAENYELIGVRPNSTRAELLVTGESGESIRDLLADNSPDECHGYDRYQMIEPGQVRTITVIETSRTIYSFVGTANFDDFAYRWIQDFDKRTMSPERFSSLHGRGNSESTS